MGSSCFNAGSTTWTINGTTGLGGCACADLPSFYVLTHRNRQLLGLHPENNRGLRILLTVWGILLVILAGATLAVIFTTSKLLVAVMIVLDALGVTGLSVIGWAYTTK